MRTFILLTSILLVALQAKAEPVPPTDDEVLGQEQLEAGDQVMAKSFSTDEETALQETGQHDGGLNCHCRKTCHSGAVHGPCYMGPNRYKLCCTPLR